MKKKPTMKRFKRKSELTKRNVAKDVKALVRAATYIPRQLLKGLSGKGKMQPPTPSAVKTKTTTPTTTPTTTTTTTAQKPTPQATGGNRTGGNRAGSLGSKKNPITPKAEKKAPTITKEQRVGGRRKSSSPAGAASQQQKIKDEIASLKIKIKNAKTGKQKNKLQKRLESLQAKLK